MEAMKDVFVRPERWNGEERKKEEVRRIEGVGSRLGQGREGIHT